MVVVEGWLAIRAAQPARRRPAGAAASEIQPSEPQIEPMCFHHSAARRTVVGTVPEGAEAI